MTGYGPVTPDDVDDNEDGPQGTEWLDHRDNCSLHWSNRCDCNDPIVEAAELAGPPANDCCPHHQ